MILDKSHPDFTGVWELDLKRSKIRGAQPKRIQVKIKHQEPKLIQYVLLTNEDGTQQQMTVNFETGNETVNSIGQRETRIRARWNETELVIESKMQSAGREVHFEDHWSLSDDGRTLVMAHHNDALAGQLSVLEKTL